MKFKVAVIGILIAILSVNIFTAYNIYTITKEKKKQTQYINAIAYAKEIELHNELFGYDNVTMGHLNAIEEIFIDIYNGKID